jgi:hypothetical protein
MSKHQMTSSGGRALLRWLVAAAFVCAVVVSGLFSGLMNRAGLLYLVFGSIAAAFMGFSRREIGAALRRAASRGGPPEETRRAAYFWEAAARNAWILGALGSALNFALVLGGESQGLQDVSHRMIQSFVVTLYGLVLAVLCLVPALKIAGRAEEPSAPDKTVASSRPAAVPAPLMERATAYVAFAAVLFLTAAPRILGAPPQGNLPIGKVLLHGPALLVVVGGTVALALFMGAGTEARAWTLGFALTGLVALLMGLIQALFGFVHKNIREISAALAFIISASSFALLGLVAVAAPLEDRELMEGRSKRPSPLSRLLWAIFPLLAFILLILTFFAVVTPMTRSGG